jgi:hypothetical protein
MSPLTEVHEMITKKYLYVHQYTDFTGGKLLYSFQLNFIVRSVRCNTIKFRAVLYHSCSVIRAIRPTTQTVQEHKKNAQITNSKRNT